NYQIVTLHTLEPLVSGRNLTRVKFSGKGTGVMMGGQELMVYGIKILSERESSIYINDRCLRGEVDIIRNKDMTLTVVNHLTINDYLYGVLPAEVSAKWPLEALKAQAIASRSYAVYQAVNGEGDYDLTSSVYSQVYLGREAERIRARKAVDETSGEVLTFDGKLFPVFFHAACGGHTEDAKRMWGLDFIPLRGIECYYCKRAPRFYWEIGMPITEVRERLAKSGFKVEKIQSIALNGRDPSNRVENVIVKCNPVKKVIPAGKFRLALGADLLRSTNFQMEDVDGMIKFSGVGWGHGVGLCQWGSHFLAKEGRNAEQILTYYFPGAKVSNPAGN
ncbi:MAG: SpoIID/LytB domain-containing protein, partial [Candidatus Omnitrophica bacterium]|nr:SpoIID/LytB domain-containing protein [Candidatus Omnitrophota bacterium]